MVIHSLSSCSGMATVMKDMALPATGRLRVSVANETGASLPARIMGLEAYGVAPGCHADLVVLQAADPVEAVRLRATRLHVLRRGKVIAETAPTLSKLDLPGRPASVDYRRPDNSEIF